MNQPITVFVDSGRAVARLSGPLILGDTYDVTFSGLSTAEAAASPEIIVLAPRPGEIAARSGADKVLAMTLRPCADVFRLPPPPPFPKEFPNPPPKAPRPLHPRGGPHASAPMHFYVIAGGQTLAQGDLVLLWAPFEYDSAGEPIQLQGEKGDKGDKGDTGAQGEPGRNGVYVAMDGLYAFHISERGDHPEDGHLWIHAQDESRLYAHDENGNYLTDSDGNRIALYYIDGRGHLLYRFFYKDSTHTELDLGRVVTREGLYAFHISDGTDGEPDGHLMMHGQDLSQLYATDADGELILDGDGNPIPLFHIDTNGHLIYTFYGVDGQAHATLDIGDVRGLPLTWDDLTEEQKTSLKGETGATGAQGPKGDPLTWSDLTPEQKAALKGEKGDPGEDGMSAEQIETLVIDTMGEADDRPTAGSKNWVTSGGLWSVEQAIIARILALATRIDAIRDKIGAAFRYRGSVQTVDDLPESADPGDVYNVVAGGGMNYAWTGSEWDALGSTIDLSAYRTKNEQDAIDATKYVKPSTGIPSSDLSQAVQDALVDARTPTAHASTHEYGGSDEIHLNGENITAGGNSFLSSGTVASAIDYLNDNKVESSSLAQVATTGDYDDLENKPTIPTVPTNVSAFTNDAGYLTAHQDISSKLDAAQRNMLVYASTTTLAPETAVYRSSLNADGTFPTITATGIPTAAAYYQFELELAVPSTVPSTITGPSGWTWIDGHGLPDPADLSGGETICISVRLDCTARTFLASVWRVA